jgi:hypothetical protein
MDEDRRPPRQPPHLVPGFSARAWTFLQLLALLLGIASIVSWIWQSIHPELLLFSLIALAFYVWTIWGYRKAAYRERDAGYTTTFGDSAQIELPGKGAYPVITLFSTGDLYQLDPRTGEVVRRPGDPDGTRRNRPQ